MKDLAPVQVVQNSSAWVNDAAYLEDQRKLLVASMDRAVSKGAGQAMWEPTPAMLTGCNAAVMDVPVLWRFCRRLPCVIAHWRTSLPFVP